MVIIKFVEPIRDKENVRSIAEYIRDKYGDRLFIMYEIGVHTGLRISDILRLKIHDVRGKEEITIVDKKAEGKKKRQVEHFIYFNKQLQSELEEYIKDKPGYWYIVHRRGNGCKPISRSYAYRVMHDAGSSFGLEHCGTHTMRKTFGYHYYNKTKDIGFLMKLYNHSSPTVTLRYIGLDREEVRKAMTYSLYD